MFSKYSNKVAPYAWLDLRVVAVVHSLFILSNCDYEISGPNRQPVAVAGLDIQTHRGKLVHLSGENSYDPDGDEIKDYLWAMLSKPKNAIGTIEHGRSKIAKLQVDVTGLWIVSLTLTDGLQTSSADTMRVFVKKNSWHEEGTRDTDGVGICDLLDECFGEKNSGDTDNDGDCDKVDTDDDGDHVDDSQDGAPLDSTLCIDSDFDGCDDCSSGIFDADNDGTDKDADGRCDALEDCRPAPVAVAVSASGKIGYTEDVGGKWTASPESGAWSDKLRDVTAGLGKYISVGDNEIMLISTDRHSWTQVVDPCPASTIEFASLLYAGVGEWAAAGFDGTGSRVLASYDHGSNWEDAGNSKHQTLAR